MRSKRWGSFSGNVKEDTNDDGIGEVDIPAVTITLEDSTGVTVATTVTDDGGDYIFYDLPADSYVVKETDLVGYTSVSDIGGGDENLIAVTIGDATGFNSTGNDFVDERPPVLGSIGGRVFEDTDDDDSGDAPLSSVEVSLTQGCRWRCDCRNLDRLRRLLPVWWLGSSRLHRGRDEPAWL